MRYKPIGLVLVAVLLLQLPRALYASEIPLATSGSIYTTPVQINRSITLDFLVDPGAGVVVIPLSVMQRLVEIGSVTESDVIGAGVAELADRSLYLTARVRLRELRVGNITVPDVTAAVSPALSQPLLGQSFLNRFASVTFDNRRHVLVLSDDISAAPAQAPAAQAVAPYYPTYPAPVWYGGGYSPSGAYGYPYPPGYGR
jgi:hypothetical protein